MFLRETLFIYATLIVLCLLGGFVVLPFQNRLRYAMLAAPFAGLLSAVMGVAAFYSVTGLALDKCIIASFVLCFLATVASLFFHRFKLRREDWIGAIGASLLVIPLTTYITETTAIRANGPALLYTDGTDHIAYAQMGDWLSLHPLAESPGSSARLPYEEYPYWLFRADPRFGSFFCIAVIRSIRHLPAVFTYDIACAVVLSAAILGVGGVFAKSRLSLAVILLGLLTSHWYDYSRSGFFGKILAYPAALFISGLFLSDSNLRSPNRIAALTILTAATALMHSGVATALFLCVLVGGCLLFRLLIGPRPLPLRRIGQSAGVLTLLMVVAVASTGLLARPVTVAFPDVHPEWSFILPRVLDLMNQRPGPQYLGTDALKFVVPLALGLWVIATIVALKARNWAAAGLIVGPMFLLLALRVVASRAAAIQLIGTIYPSSIIAMGVLISGRGGVAGESNRSATPRWVAASAVAIALACIALRVPRYADSLHRYAGKGDTPQDRYTMRDIDRLVARIGRERVEVEPMGANQALFALIELGRRDVMLQWTAQPWQTVVGGMAGWPVPRYETVARYRLAELGQNPDGLPVLCRTAQYELLDASDARHTTP